MEKKQTLSNNNYNKMTESTVEAQNLFHQQKHQEDDNSSQKLQNSGITTMLRTNSSNADHQEFIIPSCRSSAHTTITRNSVIKFQKTGDLLKMMKRQLSTQTLQKASHKDSSKPNDKLNTQHSQSQLRTSDYSASWQKFQKDEMTEAIMDEYEKQILRLKAELEDVKEEKKQVRETLQKQRRFYMTEMYNKELIIEEIDFQAQKLKGQIQKHINLQDKFQQKIRLLEIENAEYAGQLESWVQSSREHSEEMSAIYEENEDFCANSTGVSQHSRRASNRMFMSLDNGFVHGDPMMDQDPFQIMRMVHQREIQKYQKQLKQMKDYYEGKLKTYRRRSITPQKGNNKNPIHIVDEYICSDVVSCQSQSRPQNLRNMLREQFNQGRSAKKVDDTTSFASAQVFMYPIHSKKNLNADDVQDDESECEELELKCVDVVDDEVDHKQSKLKQVVWNWLPSKQFMKGLGVGTVCSGILGMAVYRSWSQK